MIFVDIELLTINLQHEHRSESNYERI